MHRFRRKSETRRSAAVPGALSQSDNNLDIPSLPSLPPASDFRTSLILPSLSRRFTILRNSSGEPLSAAQVRTRLAEQRLKGLENHITEEEEDLMIMALEEMQSSATSSNDTSARSSENTEGSSSYFADSDPQPSPTRSPESTISASRGASGNKRPDNVLFGSGSSRLRDENHMRLASKTSDHSLRSTAASNLSTPPRVRHPTRGARAETSEFSRDAPVASASPERRVVRGVEFSDPFSGYSRRTAGPPVTPGLVRRASLALAQALQDLEREMGAMQAGEGSPVIPEFDKFDDDDTVLVTPASGNNGIQTAEAVSDKVGYWVDDSHVNSGLSSPSPYRRVNSASPVPGSDARVPGYIPGMHRPITPARESDFEEFPSYSNATTPRATSPTSPTSRPVGIFGTGHLRRSSTSRSTSNTQSSRISPASPTESTTPTAEPWPAKDRAFSSPVAVPPYLSPSHSLGRSSLPLTSTGLQVEQGNGSARSSRPSTPAGSSREASGLHSRDDSSASDDIPQYFGHSRLKSSVDRGDRLPLPDSRLFGQQSQAKPWAGLPNQYDSSSVPGNIAAVAALSALRQHSPTPNSIRSPQRSPSEHRVLIPSLRSPSPAIKSTTSPPYHHTPTPSSSSSFFQFERSPTGKRFGDIPVDQMDTHSRAASPSSAPYSRALVFSPILNSSSSSVVSVGSSYHSWEETKVGSLKKLYDMREPSNDDSLDSDPTLVASDGSEEVLEKLTGLTVSDITAIHNKLVDSALYPPPEPKRSSHSRRTSLVSQSRGNLADDSAKEIITYRPPSRSAASPSPAPPVPRASTPNLNSNATPAIPSERSNTPGSDHASKANALLQSVMNSITSPSSTPPPVQDAPAVTARSTASREDAFGMLRAPAEEQASEYQRRQDLQDALFGKNGRSKEAQSAPSTPPDRTQPTPQPEKSDSHDSSPVSGVQSRSASPSPSPPRAGIVAAVSPKLQVDQLHQDVERQAAAATAALKSSSDAGASGDGSLPHRKTSKRINMSKISSPLLISSTTSVDALPIKSTSMLSLPSGSNPSSGSKFSLKKLRGSLRRQNPTGEEATLTTGNAKPVPAANPTRPVLKTSPSSSTAGKATAPASAHSMASYKFPPEVVAPPASAGPRAGLKGLMARIRRSKKGSDAIPEHEPYTMPDAVRSDKLSPSPPDWSANRPAPIPGNDIVKRSPTLRAQSASNDPRLLTPKTSLREGKTSPSPPHDEGALKQLFDAASNLGLDQEALNDFLSRSGSITSQATSRAHAASPTPNLGLSASTIDESLHESSRLPNQQPSSEAPVLPIQPQLRQHSAEPDPGTTVVRRTLYIPSDGKDSNPTDIQGLVARRSSMKPRHGRSASATSIQSGRSVLDRAPTPPPSRGARHRSMEASPPVPQLPTAIGSGANLTPPRPQSNQPSAYDFHGNGAT
ncbi:hypothetical protein BS47DRAFT_324130 [Hydnum rufescens UP504]|uniref:Uncharacterized protein n=1 Tax=Hydnum rufescens UP504 TaxID=1448309 RepID=A0A9P6E0S0_9AGAM|nr:hypothetical protein BS47DRAFT_324130 [Hydnum rufescens UP504]